MKTLLNRELAWLGLGSETAKEAKVNILGVPFDGGTSQGKGAAMAPTKIRELAAEYLNESTDSWVFYEKGLMYDHGDVEVDLNWKETFKRIEEDAYEVIKYGNFPLFIGGDHSVTIPLHNAFFKAEKEKNPKSKVGIIHFDAHFDLCYDFEGHLWSHANTERRALENHINGEDLFFLGIRAMEIDEQGAFDQYPGIGVVSATEVFEEGHVKAFEKMKKHFKGYDSIYFTLDIDVLDPAYAPGTGTPVFGGIESRELIYFVRRMLREMPIKAMDIVEISPPLDISNQITSWAGIRVVQEVFSEISKRK